MKQRRQFLAGLSTAVTSTFTQRLTAAPDAMRDVIVGHGQHRYRLVANWVTPGSARFHPILNCHEMVQVKDGRLFMVGDHSEHQMLVFSHDGKVLDSWGSGWPGGHGLSLSVEGGQEYLFVTDSGLWKNGAGAYRQTGRVSKVDLTGKEIFSISHPMSVGAYEPTMPFNPTETAVAPNGDIYIIDGYGSNFILHYNANGKFIGRYGGKDGVPETERLNNAHGIAIDSRAGADKATILATSRQDECFRRFTLDGKFIETLSVPGCKVCRPVIAGQELYAGVCWSNSPATNKLPTRPTGFTVVLDAKGKIISAPGGTAPEYDEAGKPKPLQQMENRIIDHGHDVCVLDNGNLVVCQWNAEQSYPLLLEKIA
jgi:hypothetical protein